MSENQPQKVTWGDRFGLLLKQAVSGNNEEIPDNKATNEILEMKYVDSNKINTVLGKEEEAANQKLKAYLEKPQWRDLAHDIQSKKGEKVELVAADDKTKCLAWYDEVEKSFFMEYESGTNMKKPIPYDESVFVSRLEKNGFKAISEKKEDSIQLDTVISEDNTAPVKVLVPVTVSTGLIEGTMHPLSTEYDTDSPPEPVIDDSIFQDNPRAKKNTNTDIDDMAMDLPAMPSRGRGNADDSVRQGLTVSKPVVFKDGLFVNEESDALAPVTPDAKADSEETVSVDDIELPKAVAESEPPPFFAEDLDKHLNELQKNPEYADAGTKVWHQMTKEVKDAGSENPENTPSENTAIERNETEDPFISLYETFKKSKSVKDRPRVAEKLIAFVEDARAGKITLSELKKQFADHRTFFNDAESLIQRESAAKSDREITQEPVESVALPVSEGGDVQEVTDKGIDALIQETEQKNADIEKINQTFKDEFGGAEDIAGVNTATMPDVSEAKKKLLEETENPQHGLNEKLFGKDMTPEEREAFEEKNNHIEGLRLFMTSARQEYVTVRDNKTAAIDKLKQFFGGSLKDISDGEIEDAKRRYDNAVTEYTNARLDAVRETSATPEDLKRNLVGVLEEIRLFEGMHKYNASTENAEDGLGDRMKNWSVARLDAYRDWYKNLSTAQKLAFSGAVMGVGIATGATLGAATAAFGMSGWRAFSALSTGRGLQMLGNELAQKSFEKGSEEAIAQAEAEMTPLEKQESSTEMSAAEKAEAMVAAIREKCQIDIAKSTERIDRLELNRDRSKWAGIVTGTMLAFGVPQWAIGKFFHLESVQAAIETIAHKAKEIGGNFIEDTHLVAGAIENKAHEAGSAVQKAREMLHTYAVGSSDTRLPGTEAPTLSREVLATNAAEIHSKLIFPKTIITLDQIAHEPLGHVGTVSEQISHTVAPESAKPLFDSVVTAPLSEKGTIIGSLRDMKVPGMHPVEIAKEWFSSKVNVDNPFFVPDTMTMPGAQVVVEGGKIVDIVDKQGTLLSIMRGFSGGSTSEWSKLKDIPVADLLKDRSEINQKAQELLGRYAAYLGKDMPKIEPGQTMKQLVSLTAKAYYKKKGWA